ncbi:5-methylcytosine restriction system specificity protein McrC [Nocardia asiatica]|uniref:5-methylcytosine restriction system specificity protein McrC n=1 Tax=Nocardia asiatica TaxID=209252 RepID=UPI0024540FB4|nr:hypothetical protein [Nocardia asiatica]
MLLLGEGHTRIPVRSLWFLLLLASDLLSRLRSPDREAVLAGERDEDLADMIAEIFVGEMETRLRQQLTSDYRDRAAHLDRVRGRIDHLRTESHRLLDRGRIACRFPELVVDTARNRYLAATLRKAARLVQSAELAHRCAGAAFTMQRLGVSAIPPTRVELSRDRIGMHDRADRNLLLLAHLLEDMAVPEHDTGSVLLPRLDTTAHDLHRKLFETAVRNYYRYRLEPSGWRVGARKLSWPHEPADTGADLLPEMQTDATLEHIATGRRIVVETKFTDSLTEHHDKTTIRRDHLFQLYCYLAAQSGPSEGVLLFVNTEGRDPIAKTVRLHGHLLRFISVDLNNTLTEIRRTLDSCIPLDPLPSDQTSPIRPCFTPLLS